MLLGFERGRKDFSVKLDEEEIVRGGNKKSLQAVACMTKYEFFAEFPGGYTNRFPLMVMFAFGIESEENLVDVDEEGKIVVEGAAPIRVKVVLLRRSLLEVDAVKNPVVESEPDEWESLLLRIFQLHFC